MSRSKVEPIRDKKCDLLIAPYIFHGFFVNCISTFEKLEVICLQEEAFYALIETVIKRIQEKQVIKDDKWISGEEAMEKLRIKSKTTLQKLRDEGRIRYSQPDKKLILYDADSINEYLNKHSQETF